MAAAAARQVRNSDLAIKGWRGWECLEGNDGKEERWEGKAIRYYMTGSPPDGHSLIYRGHLSASIEPGCAGKPKSGLDASKQLHTENST